MSIGSCSSSGTSSTLRCWAGRHRRRYRTRSKTLRRFHLLKTFINVGNLDAKMMENQMVLWQIIIHVTFVLSAIALAWIDRLTFKAVNAQH